MIQRTFIGTRATLSRSNRAAQQARGDPGHISFLGVLSKDLILFARISGQRTRMGAAGQDVLLQSKTGAHGELLEQASLPPHSVGAFR